MPFPKYIFALLLFGSNGVVASMIALSSYEIVLLRSLLGCLFVVSIFFIGKNKLTFPAHKKSFILLCIAGCATGATWILLYEAYQRISVSIATLCMYFGPAIVMALSPFLFRERLTRRKAVSFLLVLFGMVLINGQLAVIFLAFSAESSLPLLMQQQFPVINARKKSGDWKILPYRWYLHFSQPHYLSASREATP